MYRLHKHVTEVLLVHPGGPFWAGKEFAVWSIPKGEFGDDEMPLDAAKREVAEETGMGINLDPRLVENTTLALFLISIILSILFNIKDHKQGRS